MAALVTVAIVQWGARSDNRPTVLIGACYGVISIAAAWLALGSHPWHWRLIGTSAAVLTALASGMIGFAAVFRGGEEALIGLCASGVAQFVLLQAPYWLLRRCYRLRVIHQTELGPEDASGRLQFSLWQMLTVMTIIAVALGAGRGLVAVLRLAEQTRGIDGDIIVVFTLLVGYNLLLTWPLIWSVLSPAAARWKVPLAIVIAGVLTAVEMPSAQSLLGKGPAGFFWLINMTQVACLLAHLIAMRWCGYRLIHQPLGGSPAVASTGSD